MEYERILKILVLFNESLHFCPLHVMNTFEGIRSSGSNRRIQKERSQIISLLQFLFLYKIFIECSWYFCYILLWKKREYLYNFSISFEREGLQKFKSFFQWLLATYLKKLPLLMLFPFVSKWYFSLFAHFYFNIWIPFLFCW